MKKLGMLVQTNKPEKAYIFFRAMDDVDFSELEAGVSFSQQVLYDFLVAEREQDDLSNWRGNPVLWIDNPSLDEAVASAGFGEEGKDYFILATIVQGSKGTIYLKIGEYCEYRLWDVIYDHLEPFYMVGYEWYNVADDVTVSHETPRYNYLYLDEVEAKKVFNGLPEPEGNDVYTLEMCSDGGCWRYLDTKYAPEALRAKKERWGE